jgi:hypothetical protein
MPPVFKALASITVWVLFVFGFFTLVSAFARIVGSSIGTSEAPDLKLMYAYFGFGAGSFFLSVVAMKLRKTLE